MTGDGTNDSPALAQADVAVAMNSGTQAAKEAGNMVDLDSNPTKLIEIVEIGKQLLMTRGLADDVQPGQRRGEIFCDHPGRVCHDLSRARQTQCHAAGDACERDPVGRDFQCADHHRSHSARIARIKYRAVGAARLLRDNLLIYGLGGLVVPFIGIKLIDLILVGLRLT